MYRSILFQLIIHIECRVALMSGSVLAPWAHQVNPRANARILANNLRCFDYDASSLLQCLQVVYSQYIYLIQTSTYLLIMYWWKLNYKSTIFIFQNKPMLDIVAEVNRMVQNGNTSALFSPVNEYDWVSSDQVNFDYIVFDIDWKFSLPLDDVFYFYVTIHFSASSEKTL